MIHGVMLPWEPVLGPPMSLFLTFMMAWSCPYLTILTSATTPHKEAKGNDAKAKLAETVNKIMEKAQEDSQPLPDHLKKVCLHAYVCLHIQLTGCHKSNKFPHSFKAIKPMANYSKGTQPCEHHKCHKRYHLRDAITMQ